jgi:hypothetical protein
MRTFLERLAFPWLSYNDYSLTTPNAPATANRPWWSLLLSRGNHARSAESLAAVLMVEIIA